MAHKHVLEDPLPWHSRSHTCSRPQHLCNALTPSRSHGYSLTQPYLLTYRIHSRTPPCALSIRSYVSYSCRFPKACRRILRSLGYLDIPYFQRYEPRWQLVSANHTTVTGGNVNVSDEDSDTPLYTVEDIETACLLVDNGADPMWQNHEGLTVCEALHCVPPPRLASFLHPSCRISLMIGNGCHVGKCQFYVQHHACPRHQHTHIHPQLTHALRMPRHTHTLDVHTRHIKASTPTCTCMLPLSAALTCTLDAHTDTDTLDMQDATAPHAHLDARTLAGSGSRPRTAHHLTLD